MVPANIGTYHTVSVSDVAKVHRDRSGRPQMIAGDGIVAPIGRASDLSKVCSRVAGAQTACGNRLASVGEICRRRVNGRQTFTTVDANKARGGGV